MSDLVECVQERKHAVVTGEPGVGKTCVLRAVRHDLGTQPVRLTYCHNVTLGRRDFYRHLCHALAIPYGSTAGDVFLAVTRHVEDLARERTFPVLLIDEAHLLHQDTLDHLHILLNYSWDSKSLLSIILVGLPDLDECLSMRRNRSLHSRLTYHLSIEPLSPSDTADYIRLRLASGSLRDVDRIAHNALRLAARKKRKLVGRDIILAVLQAEGFSGGSA